GVAHAFDKGQRAQFHPDLAGLLGMRLVGADLVLLDRDDKTIDIGHEILLVAMTRCKDDPAKLNPTSRRQEIFAGPVQGPRRRECAPGRRVLRGAFPRTCRAWRWNIPRPDGRPRRCRSSISRLR